MKEFFVFLKYFARYAHISRGVIAFLLLLILLTSVLIWMVEPISFGNALYFSLITALSIGYGDIIPISTAGKVLSVFAGVLGLITIGLMVAIATMSLKSAIIQLKKFRRD